jgi:hypothetical protein
VRALANGQLKQSVRRSIAEYNELAATFNMLAKCYHAVCLILTTSSCVLCIILIVIICSGSSSALFPTQGNQLAVKVPVFSCAREKISFQNGDLHLGHSSWACCTCVKSLTSLISFDNAVSRQM